MLLPRILFLVGFCCFFNALTLTTSLLLKTTTTTTTTNSNTTTNLNSSFPERNLINDDGEWTYVTKDDKNEEKTYPTPSSFTVKSTSTYLDTKKPKSGVLIVGGKEVPKGKYPFMTSLRKSNSKKPTFCGGSLIAPNYILTAGHCATSSVKHVVIGGRHLTDIKEGELIAVEKYIQHPQFQNGESHAFDIGILKLAQPSKNLPVLLSNQTSHEGISTAAGWGFNRYGGDYSDILLETDLHLISNNQCKSIFEEVDDSMTCAGGNTGNDACQGDSGGPLFINKNGKPPTLIGIVSWGRGCGNIGLPGVYSNIAASADFINQYVVGHRWQE